jgi:hypothetical protein
MQQFKPIVLFDIDYVLFDTASFKQSRLSKYNIYSEVSEILESLSSFTTLGIFSKGDLRFQKTKLEKTGIEKYFKRENIHIFDDKNINLAKILDKYQGFKIFLVDDKLVVLYLAKECLGNVFTVWVKRGEYAENQKPIPGFTPNAEVANLSEVVKIVQSNL